MTVEVSKTVAYAVLRPAKDEATASKVTAYAVLKIGSSDVPTQSVIVIIQ